MDISAAQRMFDTNVFGVMRMVKAFAPLLVQDGDARIVNVGSMAGTIPFPLESAYAASKATVHSYSDALRVELAPLGYVFGSVFEKGGFRDTSLSVQVINVRS